MQDMNVFNLQLQMHNNVLIYKTSNVEYSFEII